MEMTREEQLDFVARNYGEWAKTECLDVAYWAESSGNLSGGVVFESSRHYPHEKCFGCYTFTRAEVEQRKAELQNKPSWNDAPDGAKILVYAQISGVWGFGSFSDACPDKDGHIWIGKGAGEWYYDTAQKGECFGDWRDTLEKRPEVDATITDEGAKQTIKPLVGDTWKYVNRSAGERFANLQLCDILDISSDETAIVRLMNGNKRAIPISDLNSLVFRQGYVDLSDEKTRKALLFGNGVVYDLVFDSSYAPGGQSNSELYPKYFKDVSGIDEIDVYGVHQLFEINDPSGAIQHASKKLLLSGVRTGGKSKYKDIKEARDTLNRWLELNNE